VADVNIKPSKDTVQSTAQIHKKVAEFKTTLNQTTQNSKQLDN